MAEQVKEENQKTVVSFVVGLLIGGLLVWAFSGSDNDKPKPADKEEDTVETATSTNKDELTETEPTASSAVATLPVGEGKVSVGENASGKTVALDSATFPTKEGWVGVRNYDDGQLGMLLGVARFSEVQGLVPTEIQLLTPTIAGRQYAIVFYSESGDRIFNLAEDVQIDKEFATFTAK